MILDREVDRRFSAALRRVSPDDTRWLLYHWHLGADRLFGVRLWWNPATNTLMEVHADAGAR